VSGYRFDENGNAIQSRVVVVWGSPASGKTTYVREHMAYGDMVVDLDLIKQAISMSGKTDAGDNLLSTAIKLRDYLYGLIARREFDCDAVWVVAGLPSGKDRQLLDVKIRPDEWLYCDATMQQCLVRAMNDTERNDKAKQQKVIRKWFDIYESE